MRITKQLLNNAILLLFLICFLMSDFFYAILKKEIPSCNLEQIENRNQKNLEEELNDLLKTYDISHNFKDKIIYSKMIYRSPFEFFNQIKILKGKSDEVSVSSAVINEQGLIGIIETVNENNSIVSLITSSDTKISVKIKNTYGILTANELNENWVTNLTQKEELEIGDKIYTSGLTEIPANVLVGEISEIKKDNLGLVQEVKIKTAVDFNKINYLFIIRKEGTL